MTKISIFIYLIIIGYVCSMSGDLDPSAKCEPYKGGSICSGRLQNNESIYITASRSQADMEKDVEWLFGFAPNACKTSFMITLVCNNVFQECINITTKTNTTQSLPVRPCRENCIEGLGQCNLMNVVVGDCTTSNGTIYEFPILSNVYNLSSLGAPPNETLKCLNTTTVNITNSTAPDIGSCPHPLIYVNSTDHARDTARGYTFLEDANCVMPCPVPFFSDDQWKSYQKMIEVVSTFSFVAMAFNVFTFGVLNKKYDRHTITVLFFSLSLFFMMLADVVFSARGWDLICPEPGRYARQFDAGCAATGIIFQFGAVSAVLWWSTMSFDLWLVIRKVITTTSYNKYYIIGINSIALILTIAPIIDNQIAYSYGGLGCWIQSDAWQNGVFWIPLCACLIVGNIFIILIIIEVYKVVSKVNREGGNKFIRMNIRPFLIIVIVFGEFIYLFGYHFYVQKNTDQWYQEMRDYLTCTITNGTNCKVEIIPYNAQFLFLFFMRLLGVESLFFYGISRRTKRIWVRSFMIQNKYTQYFLAHSRYFAKRIRSFNSNTNTTANSDKFQLETYSTRNSDSTVAMQSTISNIQVADSLNYPSSDSDSD